MKKKTYNKKPILLNDLINSTLARHGIGRQVTASLITKRSKELMRDILEDHVKNDVKVISYNNKIITIACRHHAAMREAARSSEELKQMLYIDFPDIQLNQINCKILSGDFWE
ncbi:MAG: hypothetical protein ABH846_00625 [Patescibacteria group bacterium]